MATTASRFYEFLIGHLAGKTLNSGEQTAMKTLQVATDGTQEANKFITTDSNTNQGIAKVTELHIGTSNSETKVDATPKEINEQADVSARGVTIAATKNVEESDNNRVFFLNAAGGFTTTMPKLIEVFDGWRCKFIVKAAPSGGNYIIREDDPPDADKITSAFDCAVVTSATDPAGGATHTFVNFIDGQAVAGDWCIFETDGVNWYVYGQSSVIAGVTVT